MLKDFLIGVVCIGLMLPYTLYVTEARPAIDQWMAGSMPGIAPFVVYVLIVPMIILVKLGIDALRRAKTTWDTARKSK